MTLASRIGRLEQRLNHQIRRVYFISWKGCQWRTSEGLIRLKNESINDFKKRVLKVANKNEIWVK